MQAHEDKKGPKRRVWRRLGHRFFFLARDASPGYVLFLFRFSIFCTSDRSAAAVAASTAPPHSTTITRARDTSRALAFFFCSHSFFVFIPRRVSGLRFYLFFFFPFLLFKWGSLFFLSLFFFFSLSRARDASRAFGFFFFLFSFNVYSMYIN